MKKLTLVILAAGMGSRYGRLKQLDTMSKEGDTIIDFSIYDAIEAGFSKIVFVVRKSFKDDFKRLFTKKLNGKIALAFVCQEVDNIPIKYVNKDRVKPLGTAQALLVAKDEVKGNFAVINADDFYGKDAFKVIADKLQTSEDISTKFSMVGFRLKNTISQNGAVSRGECSVCCNNLLENIIERTHIKNYKNGLYYKDEEGIEVRIDENTIVSMNFWGFTPKIFLFLESQFHQFLRKYKNDLTKEFFLPSVINNLIENNVVLVEVLQSNSKWLGITYKEDKLNVIEEIKMLKKEGIYPKKMW